mgnify:CR=1 FL=1
MKDGIYLVTDEKLCGPRGVVETVRLAVDGGVTTVQLRDKHADLASQVAQLEQLAEVIDGRACLIVNDRLDAFLEARRRGIPVDGLHVGQGDVAPEQAREQIGADAVLGLSTDTIEHIRAAEALPKGTVDYLGIGTIRATATKDDAPEALGVEGFGALAGETSISVCAIGGIRADDVPALRRAGADAVAVVSAICAAGNPEAAAREMVQLWEVSGRSAR